MSEDSETKPRLQKRYTGAGVGVGAAVGVALGLAIHQLALGIAIGTALGAFVDVVAHLRYKTTNTPR